MLQANPNRILAITWLSDLEVFEYCTPTAQKLWSCATAAPDSMTSCHQFKRSLIQHAGHDTQIPKGMTTTLYGLNCRRPVHKQHFTVGHSYPQTAWLVFCAFAGGTLVGLGYNPPTPFDIAGEVYAPVCWLGSSGSSKVYGAVLKNNTDAADHTPREANPVCKVYTAHDCCCCGSDSASVVDKDPEECIACCSWARELAALQVIAGAQATLPKLVQYDVAQRILLTTPVVKVIRKGTVFYAADDVLAALQDDTLDGNHAILPEFHHDAVALVKSLWVLVCDERMEEARIAISGMRDANVQQTVQGKPVEVERNATVAARAKATLAFWHSTEIGSGWRAVFAKAQTADTSGALSDVCDQVMALL
ncbi:hypothetical protein JKP88DRAFT_245867 [Tribonema minus]|uniref:Uncharacterized protein n=1 Tax=Tribonema minus TaxID=303371 RepID=A0A835YYS9_9STRA|nr:hypothetical protein JKP88DRAFT_245867 [Tribonema minus]